MIRPGLLAAAGLLLAAPSFAQTVGPCPGNVGSAAVSKPSWVLFDLGSAVVKPEYKATIAEAAKTAKDRQATRSASSARPTSWATRTTTPSLPSSARRQSPAS